MLFTNLEQSEAIGRASRKPVFAANTAMMEMVLVF
jgi:hypothetical protein